MLRGLFFGNVILAYGIWITFNLIFNLIFKRDFQPDFRLISGFIRDAIPCIHLITERCVVDLISKHRSMLVKKTQLSPQLKTPLRPRPHVYVFIAFPYCFRYHYHSGAIVFYSLEDGEQYKNARKTYTCGRGLRISVFGYQIKNAPPPPMVYVI